MAKQNINVGTAANDKKGDSLRAAFVKVNANFTELYTELGLVVDANLNLGAFEFAGSTLSTTDSTAIVIDQAVTVSSDLTVDVLTTFNSDVVVENDLTVAERLTVKGSRVINLTELQSVVAASISFADFQTRIAALA